MVTYEFRDKKYWFVVLNCCSEYKSSDSSKSIDTKIDGHIEY